MRHRTMSPPDLAMLAAESNTLPLAAAGQQQMAYMQGRGYAAGAPAAARYATMPHAGGVVAGHCMCGRGCGCQDACGCGTTCGCGHRPGRHHHFPPARRREDGSCASIFQVSCETQWRVRECFKIAFCDLLRCLGETYCEDGKFVGFDSAKDPAACFNQFLCTLLTCLPDAICPPPEPKCCPPQVAADCDCNFATGR